MSHAFFGTDRLHISSYLPVYNIMAAISSDAHSINENRICNVLYLGFDSPLTWWEWALRRWTGPWNQSHGWCVVREKPETAHHPTCLSNFMFNCRLSGIRKDHDTTSLRRLLQQSVAFALWERSYHCVFTRCLNFYDVFFSYEALSAE